MQRCKRLSEFPYIQSFGGRIFLPVDWIGQPGTAKAYVHFLEGSRFAALIEILEQLELFLSIEAVCVVMRFQSRLDTMDSIG